MEVDWIYWPAKGNGIKKKGITRDAIKRVFIPFTKLSNGMRVEIPM